jgi:hypothetical protein
VRIAQLIRLYPPAWRRRYGDEFVEMLGDRPLGARKTIDVVMGAVDAWTSRRVRGGAAAAAGSSRSGGDAMVRMLKLRCSNSSVRYTKRDALISAGVLVFGSTLLVVAGIFFDRAQYPVLADVLKSLSFPVALVISMPFALTKGQPMRVQIVISAVTIALLFLATWVATKI